MKKKKLIAALGELGLHVAEGNGLLWISSVDGTFMVLRIHCYYSKAWIFLHCFVYRDLFKDGNWRQAYQSIISNNQQLNTMEQTFTNEEVRSYLRTYYSPTFRKGSEDHFYNHRNRETIGLPIHSVKQEFTEHEVVTLFSNKGEFPPYIEIIRFKQYITNNKNDK